MAPKHLVLLPGLDGTGKLFVAFVAALPDSCATTIVAYPSDRFLPYADLRAFVRAAVPESERFVLVAESFSTPLAIWYAATNPPNLVAPPEIIIPYAMCSHGMVKGLYDSVTYGTSNETSADYDSPRKSQLESSR